MRQLILWTILLLSSCDTTSNEKDLVEYKDGRQLLTLNGIKGNGDVLGEIEIGKVIPDSVKVGDQFLAKVFLKDKDFKLVAAYVNCATVDKPSVDTTINTINKYKRLSGCKEGLVIESDTIYIYFRPVASGLKKFQEITILTRDEEKIFRTQKYSFDYKVVED